MRASPKAELPDLNIVFENHYHSTLEIKGLMDDPLQFSNVTISGSSAMVYLNNTSISKGMSVNLDYGRIYLNNFIFPYTA